MPLLRGRTSTVRQQQGEVKVKPPTLTAAVSPLAPPVLTAITAETEQSPTKVTVADAEVTVETVETTIETSPIVEGLSPNTVIREFEEETGCPVYSTTNTDANSVAELMLFPAKVDLKKVCVTVPPACPDIGDYIFVISLDHVDPETLSYDELGKWGRCSGHRFFIIKTDNPKFPLRRVGKDKEPNVAWDYFLRCNRYSHQGQGLDGKNKFQKMTYVAFNENHEMLGPYAVITYNAEIHPTTLRHLVQGLAKSDRRRTHKRKILNKPSMSPSTEMHETMRAIQSIDDPDISLDSPPTKQVKGSTPPIFNSEYVSPILKNEVLQAEKRKHEVETEKLEYELCILKTKKYKMDLEIARMKSEMDPRIVESVAFDGDIDVQ